MSRKRVLPLMLLLVGVLAVGCAGQAVKSNYDFAPQDLGAKMRSGEYIQKAENFLVVLDASDSMGGSKFATAQKTAVALNRTVPEMPLQSALRSFGSSLGKVRTQSIQPLQAHDKSAYEAAVESVGNPWGDTPLAAAVTAAGDDLSAAQGNIALIVVSDGLNTSGNPIEAAKGVKAKFGDRICIYTIQVGSSAEGKQVLDEMVKAGGCGFAANAGDVATPAGMAAFVEKAFLEKAPPKPAAVAPAPAPAPMVKDTDGDGVPDDRDKCPGTPKGVPVDPNGCWVLKNVQFDFDKSVIKPQYYPNLNEVVAYLKNNPGVRVEIQGHTDNVGTRDYNQKLSERRAKAVVDYVTSKGIDASRLTSKGFNFSVPAATNETEEGRAINRRVVVQPLN